jgi:hypothetical protein
MLVSELARDWLKQKKRQNKQTCGNIDKVIAFLLGYAGNLEGNKNRQPVLIKVVVESPQQLSQEERTKSQARQ